MTVDEVIERLAGGRSDRIVAAAERLGVKRTTVAMWASKQHIPLRRIPEIARAINVSPVELWPELAETLGAVAPKAAA